MNTTPRRAFAALSVLLAAASLSPAPAAALAPPDSLPAWVKQTGARRSPAGSR